MSRQYYFSAIIIFFLFSSCAVQVPPTGGVKDSTPPKLLSSTPENYTTDFNGREIVLEFDEYISLNDIGAQLIVSPLLKYPVETKIRKKSLLIRIQDTLEANTTYTFNFGNGIADNNEGNKLEDFQFVFSTGPIVDSLNIRGRMISAFDNKPEKGVLALLYRQNDDSLPFLERPVYFAKVNDNGEYRISNISPGSYKIIGLKDADGNYLYTSNEEMIAFSDTPVIANSVNADMKLFREVPKLKFLKAYSEYAGKVVMVFNTNADTIKWKWLSDTTKLQIYGLDYSIDRDSISIYYQNPLSDSLIIRFDNVSLNDTVALRLFKLSEESKGRGSRSMEVKPAPRQTEVQHLHLPYYLQSNRPLEKAEFSKIIFMEDSVPVVPAYFFTDSVHTRISIKYPWKSKGKYSIFIPPVTFTDIYGKWNDTIKIQFNAHSETDYGSIKINFRKNDQSDYLIQLVDATGASVFREQVVTSDTIFEFSNLDPRLYKIKMIRDSNKNGKWDTGNYLKHIQPEGIEFYPEDITVRANWDVEVSLRIPLVIK